MNRSGIVFIVLAASFCSAVAALASSLDRVQFIKASSHESAAVIRTAAGKILVIKTGDQVAENVTAKEITAGRIILEEKTPHGSEILIVRFDGGRTRIERLRRQPDPTPLPAMHPLDHPVSSPDDALLHKN